MKAFENELRYSPVRLLPALLLLLAGIAAVTPRPAFAGIPQSINYQGFLLSKGNSLPVETPRHINFVIYNAATGGAVQFTDPRCNVAVNKGRYDVEIGSGPNISGDLPATFINNQNLWLEIQVDPDGNCSGTYEAMTPRIRLQASPFSFNSLYASTASAGTPVFAADTIAALPFTSNGAITISTNLFVLGGISVGNISPGQQLSVAGMVESKGTFPACSLDATCGFRFPDGSIQYKAAASEQWDVNGPHLFNKNTGNVGIGEYSNPPLARLHVSSAIGDTGSLLILSTGTAAVFRVNGLGQVYGNRYYGDGSTLTGIVAKAGDTMTGALTLPADGINTPRIKLLDGVTISSSPALASLFPGGILVSSHVYVIGYASATRFYGDGSGLTNVVTLDGSKVLKAGDTMSGQLTLANSTLTVTGNAFSVGLSTLSVFGGNTALGGAAYQARLTVGGGIIASSSITAQGGLYSNSVSASGSGSFNSVYIGSATFWGTNGSADPATSFSIDTATGIRVNAGAVVAPYFIGNGSKLTSVTGTDATKLLKAGDTMSGNLTITPSSVTIISMGAHNYALTVATAADAGTYSFAVSTAGNVGIQVSDPSSPLTVYKQIFITNNNADVSSNIHMKSQNGPGYIYWSDGAMGTMGAMGYLPNLTRDFAFRAMGSRPDGAGGGTEVFRIKTDMDETNGASWKFGIGIIPTEKFHVGANMLVSAGATPILYVSTVTQRVGVGSTTPDRKFYVNGGIVAVSSITAQGGFFGDGAGITNISAGGLPVQVDISSIAARSDSTYGAVVFTSNTYVNAMLAVGQVFTPAADLHVRGNARLDNKDGTSPVALRFHINQGAANSYISWGDDTNGVKGALGMLANNRDLIYKTNTEDIAGGDEAFRITGNDRAGLWRFGIGTTAATLPQEKFHVMSNMLVGPSLASPIMYISTTTNSVGISTGTPKERMHVASSFLVGPDHASAVLYVSTGPAWIGMGTANPRARLEVSNGTILADGTGGSLPMTGAGTRFMWVPSLAAIRAGAVNGTEWDTVGSYSVAFGNRNSATASESTVTGGFNNAVAGLYSLIGGGHNNVAQGMDGVVAAGENNYLTGRASVIPGGAYNVALSSYGFAGGYNSFLDTDAKGTFAWGYDDTHPAGYTFNTFKISTAYAFLIDPANVHQYKVGIRTEAPQAALDVNGDAQFGSGVDKSTFTAQGFWVPRWIDTATLRTVTPSGVGQVVGNSTLMSLCVSTAATRGGWAAMGAGGVNPCQ